jgi:3-(3-hydroxy-phenyl)propionate hydroxylase
MKDVVIVGGGPTGLMLAGELALAGVDVVILERRPTQELVGSRGRGFHSRTIEILDQRGIVDRFLAEGQVAQPLAFANTRLDLSGFPSRHPYTLGIGQRAVERILLGWVEELGVPVRRGIEVTGFAQDDDGVDVHLAERDAVRTTYLVGADGGRSVIRKAAGIDFVGEAPNRSNLIAEVRVTEETPPGMRLDDLGIHAFDVGEDKSTVRVVVTEQRVRSEPEPTLADLREAVAAVYGTDFGMHDPTWISRFTDATRQAADYRNGRVLLAGDSAHIHPPTGGQGIGLGVQDAVNLGWKLAQVVQGISPDTLLDSYHSERHPATARVLKNVMTQAFLQRGDARTRALRETIDGLAGFDEPRAHLAGVLSGLDIRYGPGDGHPLLGRRMPDLDLTTAAGPRRVFELLHEARPVLLDLGGPEAVDLGPWADRVRHVRAGCADRWELPLVGTVAAPAAVLVRPDGHVAWAGDGSDTGLSVALGTWCGISRAAAPTDVGGSRRRDPARP